MGRAAYLNQAKWHLESKYTYDIVGRNDLSKVAARTKIGEMAGEVLTLVIDDLVKGGVSRYLQSLGWDTLTIAMILNGKKNV